MAEKVKRVTDIGPPHHDKLMPQICKDNYGAWKYHEVLKPGVMVHVGATGDKLFTVRAAGARLVGIRKLRLFADLADKYCGGHLRFTSRHNIEFLLTDEANIDPLIAEQGKLQRRIPVLGAEKQPKGVLGIESATAESAANPQSRVDPESFTAVRIDQFHRRRPFPLPSILPGVDVNAGRGVGQICDIGDQRNRWDLRQGIDQLRPPDRIVDDVWVHPVIEGLALDRARGPAGWRRAVG